MARLKRAESRSLTQARLLAAARELFSREGYAATSLERIALKAGYSKGAVYSNFDSKDEIFLAVLEAQGLEALEPLLDKLEELEDVAAVIDHLADWADTRSRSGGWSLTILEHARMTPPDAPSMRRQKDIIRDHWRRLGERVAPFLPDPSTIAAETLGALLHEIAYAPALTFIETPTAGDLMRMAMSGLSSTNAEKAT